MQNSKKAQWKWLMMFLSTTFAVGMTSCNSEDDETSSETTHIWVVDTMLEKYSDPLNPWNDRSYIYEYSYDGMKRMTQAKRTYVSGYTMNTTAEYLNDKIIVTVDDDIYLLLSDKRFLTR